MTEPTEAIFEGAEGNRLVGTVYGGDWTGPMMLFMHGGGQTRHAWDAVAARLGRTHPVTTLDARGHGDSEWVASGDYRFEAMGKDLERILDCSMRDMGEPAIVVGASMGGLASLVVARTRPDLFGGLVLVDITPRMEQSGVDHILRFMAAKAEEGFARIEDVADAVATYLPDRKRPRSLAGLEKNLVRRDDGRWYWHWDPRFVSGPLAVERDAAGSVEQLEEGLRRLTCPIMLVRGSRSNLVSEASVREFREQVPHAQFVDVSGAGHMVAGDRNDAFGAAIERFATGLKDAR